MFIILEHDGVLQSFVDRQLQIPKLVKLSITFTIKKGRRNSLQTLLRNKLLIVNSIDVI